MENPIKMDDLGVPLFLETPISCSFTLFNRLRFVWGNRVWSIELLLWTPSLRSQRVAAIMWCLLLLYRNSSSHRCLRFQQKLMVLFECYGFLWCKDPLVRWCDFLKLYLYNPNPCFERSECLSLNVLKVKLKWTWFRRLDIGVTIWNQGWCSCLLWIKRAVRILKINRYRQG